jgi:TRAP-type C4-dicarboxylate transport system substrate-binding protein
MKNFLLLFVALMVAVFLVAGYASAAPQKPAATPTPGKIHEWKLIIPGRISGYPFLPPILDDIGKRSGGRIKIKLFQSGEHPYGYGDMMGVLRDRKADLSWLGTWGVGAVEPIMTMTDLPYILSSVEEMRAMLKATDYADIRQTCFDKPLAKWNQIALFYHGFSDIMIAFNDFFTSFDSLKGKKIRAHTAGLQGMVSALGGVPVSVEYSELYTAMQRGIVEGIITDFTSSYLGKRYEIVKYVTLAQIYTSNSWIAINRDSFNALPKDLQDVVLKIGSEREQWIHGFMEGKFREYAIEAMRVNGVRMTAIDPVFREKVRVKMKAEVWPDLMKLMGPDGLQVLDRIEKFHSEWIKSH